MATIFKEALTFIEEQAGDDPVGELVEWLTHGRVRFRFGRLFVDATVAQPVALAAESKSNELHQKDANGRFAMAAIVYAICN